MKPKPYKNRASAFRKMIIHKVKRPLYGAGTSIDIIHSTRSKGIDVVVALLTNMPTLGLGISSVPDHQGRIVLLSRACL